MHHTAVLPCAIFHWKGNMGIISALSFNIRLISANCTDEALKTTRKFHIFNTLVGYYNAGYMFVRWNAPKNLH